MGTALLALCFCALSLVLALFVGISPISDKAKIRFMYVGAALSLIAVPMMSHYILSCNNKAFLIGQEVCFIIYKRHIFSHIGINDFWLRKILPIISNNHTRILEKSLIWKPFHPYSHISLSALQICFSD